MPASEQIDMFAPPAAVVTAPIPTTATPKPDPIFNGPDWPKLREDVRATTEAAVRALDVLRSHDGLIRAGQKAIDIRRTAGTTPVPQPWLDKFNGLLAQRRDMVRSAIGYAFIPYLLAIVAQQLAANHFLGASPSVQKAMVKNGGPALVPDTDVQVVMAALVKAYNATMPGYLFHTIEGSDSLAKIDADNFEHIDWSTDESRESYARLEAVKMEPVDTPELIAAASEYLTLSLRLAWAIRPTSGEAT